LPRRLSSLLPPSEQHAWRSEIQEAKDSDSHGDRVERRRLLCTGRLKSYLDWPGAEQVCLIERTRIVGCKESTETAYAITSLSPQQANARQLLNLSRNHWSIENSLHWVRDCTFGEDACQVKSGHGPQLLASLRNLSLSLLHRSGVKKIAATLRSNALNPQKSFAALGLKAVT